MLFAQRVTCARWVRGRGVQISAADMGRGGHSRESTTIANQSRKEPNADGRHVADPWAEDFLFHLLWFNTLVFLQCSRLETVSGVVSGLRRRPM